ncbi:tyrosine-type recombinase/integrase [Pedobacter jejuensis]|uniref:Tyr recombinase domain-containing protein n=1 Tax=Pedobacter jejuensis TaxID=1268550 RepID=A0A3N0BMY0_9SPHI|nr:tyrosine-type recombinase/integrase [Pedobacter jejuensis]RNL50111.1 hypothetical protein D7004_17995 [Pedobacter jejuensis]
MANCNLYHDKRRSKKNDLYPIKIRITHERKSKFFETVFSADEPEYAKILSGLRLDAEQKKTKSKLNELLKKANDIIEDLEVFNFETFTTRFKNTGDRNNLLDIIREKATSLKEEENFANSRLYFQSADLIERFNVEQKKSKSLFVRDLTPDYLKAFQKWATGTNYIIDKNKDKLIKTYSVTTLNMYLTRIKAVVNSLVERGELHISKNPFGKGKYIIPKSRSAKRPLEHAEIMSIVNYQCADANEIFARDMFIFSYVANGMNFYDIFKLKWSDIKGDAFYFIRQKTSTKLPDKQIRVFLNPKIQSVIDAHGSRKLGNNYIFNVVPWGATKDVEQRKIRSSISTVNMKLKKIATSLGITSDISTYFARHTFATMMHDLGASINTIRDVIGHEDIKSTQSYIGSERTEKLREFQEKLIN